MAALYVNLRGYELQFSCLHWVSTKFELSADFSSLLHHEMSRLKLNIFNKIYKRKRFCTRFWKE